MYILVIVQRHGDMSDLLATKENQIALLQIGSLDSLHKESMLLVGISGNDVPSHAITELYKTAAINPLAACPTPEVRYIQ
jgi:hypothetical protein